MAGFQDVLDQIALIVGGTQQGGAAVKMFSGYKQGDGTGIAGINAAYSSPPSAIQDPPMAVVLMGPFDAKLNMQGLEENVDNVLIRVFVANNDPETQYPNLTPFRDSFPTAFRAKMQLNNTLNVSSAFISHGQPGVLKWGGQEYIGIDFTLRVLRLQTGITYTP